MSLVSVHVDASAFNKHVDELGQGLLRAAERAMREALATAEAVATGTTVYRDRTGTLRRKTKTRRFSVLDGELRADTPYARFVESGTRPHPIYPRNAQFLRFKVGDRIVLARKVNHPGTKPGLFIANAKKAAARDLVDSLATYTDQAADAFNSKA